MTIAVEELVPAVEGYSAYYCAWRYKSKDLGHVTAGICAMLAAYRSSQLSPF